MDDINHFSHWHPLRWYENGARKPWESYTCRACGKRPSQIPEQRDSGTEYYPIYGCRECSFFIHFSCSNLPQKVNHPFHPQHALSLLDVKSQASKKFPCHACGLTCSNFVYQCADCDFNLDLDCIQLQPSRTHTANSPEISHPHPLYVCAQPPRFNYPCSFCGYYFFKEESIYVCIHCKNLFHEWCVYPLEIKHPFHSEHPLAILPPGACGAYKCNACSSTYSDKVSYCSQCNFCLGLNCAFLMPISTNLESDPELNSHSHPLIQCNKTKKISIRCSGCDLPIEGSIFVCLKCGILLDKLCSELLKEIEHPLHQEHPLQLVDDLGKKYSFRCKGCRRTSTGIFTYVCWKCNFNLDPRCASTNPHLIKSKIHQHPLAFLNTKLDQFLTCNSCGGTRGFERHCFQCLDCEFGLHLKCYPSLPQVIKHECHCDPLTLNYSRIKDASDEDSDEEFYCHACEELRNLDDPTYYCKDCHFVAHLHCVVSEILGYLVAEAAAAPLTSSEPTESLEPLPSSELCRSPPSSESKSSEIVPLSSSGPSQLQVQSSSGQSQQKVD